jgi:phage shock protein PspC (stress-responsive transcriptional regulator)
VTHPAPTASGPASPEPMPPASVAPPSRRLQRHRSGRLVAGVAGGIADHLDVNVLWVRAAFVALMAVGGAGVVAYGLLWIFVRQEGAGVERVVPPRERQQALGLAALGLGVGLAASALGRSASSSSGRRSSGGRPTRRSAAASRRVGGARDGVRPCSG